MALPKSGVWRNGSRRDQAKLGTHKRQRPCSPSLLAWHTSLPNVKQGFHFRRCPSDVSEFASFGKYLLNRLFSLRERTRTFAERKPTLKSRSMVSDLANKSGGRVGHRGSTFWAVWRFAVTQYEMQRMVMRHNNYEWYGNEFRQVGVERLRRC